MKNPLKTYLDALLCSFLVVVLFSLSINLIELYNDTIFYTFQMRDILRAKELLQGKLYFFGSEMTGGGNLPGPLYYIILAIGFLINNEWYSAWLVQYLLALLACLSGLLFFRKHIGLHFGFLWVILLGSAPFTFWFLKVFLNVSSTIVFVVAGILLICEAYNCKEETSAKKKALYFAFLVIGFGLQFHFSIFFLFLALVFIQLAARWLHFIPFDNRTFFIGMLLFILPSTPYLAWLMAGKMGIDFGEKVFYVGQGGGTLDSLIYLIKNIKNQPLDSLFSGSLQKILFTIPFPLVPLLFSDIGLRKILREDRYRILFVCLLFSFIPYLNWYLSPQAVRYTMLFYLLLLFVTLFFFSEVLKNDKKLMRFNFLATGMQAVLSCIYLFYYPDAFYKNFFIGLVGLTGFVLLSLKFTKGASLSLSSIIAHCLLISLVCTQKIETPLMDIKFKDKSNYMPNLVEWRKIWETIYDKTGWSYDQARRRIYFVGHHMSQSPELSYEAFEKKSLNLLEPMPDGFIVSNRYFAFVSKKKRELYFSKHRHWLLKQNLPKDFIQALEMGIIALGDNLSNQILIVPYYVKDKTLFPRFFHNTGEGYRSTPDDDLLLAVKENVGVVKIGKNKAVFKWNECPDNGEFCSTGAQLSWYREQNTFLFDLKIVGSALSQISPWISPNWTQAWIMPYLEVYCDDGIQKHEIISSVGFRRKLTHNRLSPFFQGNNSFLAPLERNIITSCKNIPTKVSIGRIGSEVDQVTQVLSLPGAKLTFDIEPF